MTDPYTPTTEEVREAASQDGATGIDPEAFDRWLATVRAEGAAEMRERAAKDVEEAARVLEIGAILIRPNKATAELIEAFRAAFQRTANFVRALPPLSPQPDTTTALCDACGHNPDLHKSDSDGAWCNSNMCACEGLYRLPPSAVPEPTGDHFLHIADASGNRHNSNPTKEDVARVRAAVIASSEPTGDEQ